MLISRSPTVGPGADEWVVGVRVGRAPGSSTPGGKGLDFDAW
jgi:hypothetical protein